ncbi:MAG: tRNA (cytidine(34)-2'-O)-methyltransferase, partial [Gammaproteobacteria bacterium]
FIRTVNPESLYAVSTRCNRLYTDVTFKSGTALLLGPETRGLPAPVLEGMPADHVLRIPMHAGSRSLNLSNAVAIMVYEVWRQLGYPDFEQ